MMLGFGEGLRKQLGDIQVWSASSQPQMCHYPGKRSPEGRSAFYKHTRFGGNFNSVNVERNTRTNAPEKKAPVQYYSKRTFHSAVNSSNMALICWLRVCWRGNELMRSSCWPAPFTSSWNAKFRQRPSYNMQHNDLAQAFIPTAISFNIYFVDTIFHKRGYWSNKVNKSYSSFLWNFHYF